MLFNLPVPIFLGTEEIQLCLSVIRKYLPHPFNPPLPFHLCYRNMKAVTATLFSLKHNSCSYSELTIIKTLFEKGGFLFPSFPSLFRLALLSASQKAVHCAVLFRKEPLFKYRQYKTKPEDYGLR